MRAEDVRPIIESSLKDFDSKDMALVLQVRQIPTRDENVGLAVVTKGRVVAYPSLPSSGTVVAYQGRLLFAGGSPETRLHHVYRAVDQKQLFSTQLPIRALGVINCYLNLALDAGSATLHGVFEDGESGDFSNYRVVAEGRFLESYRPGTIQASASSFWLGNSYRIRKLGDEDTPPFRSSQQDQFGAFAVTPEGRVYVCKSTTTPGNILVGDLSLLQGRGTSFNLQRTVSVGTRPAGLGKERETVGVERLFLAPDGYLVQPYSASNRVGDSLLWCPHNDVIGGEQKTVLQLPKGYSLEDAVLIPDKELDDW